MPMSQTQLADMKSCCESVEDVGYIILHTHHVLKHCCAYAYCILKTGLYIMLLTTGKTTHLACDGLMLGQLCGRWVSNHTTQGQCAVFVEKAGYRYILDRVV